MSPETIQDRIDEIELSHKVEGGTHFEGVLCPACKTIEKLKGLKKQYLSGKSQELFKNDKLQPEVLNN